MNWILLLTLLGYCLCKEYKAVDNLDINMYMGKWLQVYGNTFDKVFQGNGKCATAQYSLQENGEVKVYNEQIDSNGKRDGIEGYAYYNDDDCCGYLTVKLEDLKPAPYWVLELGPLENKQYQYAIVSDDKALSLFVLTRDVDDFQQKYEEQVLVSMKEFGFTKSLNKPVPMNQTDC